MHNYTVLLQAAFADPEKASKAWREYSHHDNPQEADSASITLFPLIYRRFHPSAWEYKSVYRHIWYSNQLYLTKLKEVVDCLNTASIPFCLLNDAALLLAYYEDLGLRAIRSLDILVSEDRFKEAQSCLKGLDVGVHPTLFSESRIDSAFRQFTYRSYLIPSFSITPILSPEDQLILTLFRGLKYNDIRWKKDACMLLKKSVSFQWDYFLLQASSLKLKWMISQALVELDQQQLILLPRHVKTVLNAHCPTKAEIRYFKFLKKKAGKPVSAFSYYWQAHLRNATTQNIFKLILTWPFFCKKSKGFVHWREFFFFLVRKFFFQRLFNA